MSRPGTSNVNQLVIIFKINLLLLSPPLPPLPPLPPPPPYHNHQGVGVLPIVSYTGKLSARGTSFRFSQYTGSVNCYLSILYRESILTATFRLD